MQTCIRQRWPEIRALFEAAIELPREQRAAYLLAATADPLLRDAVRGLLHSEENAASATTLEPDSAAMATTPAAAGAIPGYRIQRLLGRGGMGVVYLAEQEQPRRLVALKLISGEHDASALARFAREGESLARLSHPGIAQVHAAGNHDGRPYLAMEFVDGLPLETAALALDRRTRLELLVRIAEAVDHAHSRGVIHRDLKPSNILVTPDGQPKILDFGIAAINEVGAESLTATGMLLGTPAYMSPEQASGRYPTDARADVYALGVIGYELLARRLPLPVAGLTPLQALRVLGEQTPPPLARIDHSLRGDLDIIIGCALAKDPQQRYASAGALADDLRRFLANEPILARRPGWWHRLRLFGRRNPLLLAMSGATALSLIGGLLVSLWLALGQSRERERAEIALAKSESTLAALRQLFSAGNPALAGQPEVSFRTVLNSAFELFAGLPADTRAEVGFALTEALASMGEVAAAKARLAELQELATAIGDDRLRLRIAHRHLALLVEFDSAERATALLDALLADPAVQRDPLILGLLRVRQAEIAQLNGGMLSVVRSLAAAEALFPPPPDPRDSALRAELEARLLNLRTLVAQFRADFGQSALARIAQINEALPHLQTTLGREHPIVLQLSILAAAVPSSFAERADWAPGLLEEIRTRIPELGITHPAILARIEASRWIDTTIDAAVHLALLELAIEATRALPLDSRWRARVASNIARDGWSRGTSTLTVEEFLGMREAQCPQDRPLNYDCALLLDATARRLRGAGRTEDALVLIGQALQAPSSARWQPAVEYVLYNTQAVLLRSLRRYDEAAAAADQAIAATQRYAELDDAVRAVWVFLTAWHYRPHHCARVLDHILPLEPLLRARQGFNHDTLARLLSTCEVRVGRDPAAAIARMDRAWAELTPNQAPDSLVRMELINGYLELYDVLRREDEFAHWAAELDAMVQRGLRIEPFFDGGFPWIERARRLHGDPRATLPTATRDTKSSP